MLGHQCMKPLAPVINGSPMIQFRDPHHHSVSSLFFHTLCSGHTLSKCLSLKEGLCIIFVELRKWPVCVELDFSSECVTYNPFHCVWNPRLYAGFDYHLCLIVGILLDCFSPMQCSPPRESRSDLRSLRLGGWLKPKSIITRPLAFVMDGFLAHNLNGWLIYWEGKDAI